MARRRRHRLEDEALIPADLTPLIDIVFLLLIFFIVSARIFDPSGYDVELPESEAAPQRAPSDLPIVVVQPDGTARIDGEAVDVDAALPFADGLERAILRADKRSSHGDVMITEVTLATEPVESPSGP